MYRIKESEFDEAMEGTRRYSRGWSANPNHVNNYSLQLDGDLAAREKERRMRDELNSQDGDTAELHDQFYRDHKLLLVLFRVLAVMPITRSSPGRITFSWKSKASLYAFVFYSLATVVVVRVGLERIQILRNTKQFDEYVYGIIFVVFLVPHFWIPFVGWGVANDVSVYKTMWGAFQVRFYRVTGESLKFPHLNLLIVLIFVGCLVCAVVFLISLSLLLDGFYFWHTSAYYHIVIMINMNSGLWYINCRGVRVAATSLSRCFKRVRSQIQKIFSDN